MSTARKFKRNMSKSTFNKNNSNVKTWNSLEAMSTLSTVYYKHATDDNPNPELRSEPNYSFMSDLYVYYNNPDKMDNYIERMLNEYCVHNFMAYMELLDTIGFTAYLFNTMLYMNRKEDSLFQIIKDDDNFLATLEKWYNKLMYKESFYSKYCTDEEIKKVWRWLN